MSKIARAIAIIAAVVAIAATIAITLGASAVILGASLSTIAAAASAISAVAGAIAQATMKPPDMKGSVSQVVIGKNMPVPYAMGRTYLGGLQIYDKTAGGPDNVDRTMINVLTCAGPIDSFEALQADYTTISFAGSAGGLIGPGVASGFYGADGGYMWASSRKGNRPETAFTSVPPRYALSEWGAAFKLSGFAAYAVTMEFDEDGKRYASGVPQYGAIFKAVKVYDPRLDTSYPGGAGSHRWDDESTWTWSENPGLHALAYSRGRFIEKDAAGVALAEPVKIVGCGFPKGAIRVDQFVELANLCDANGWAIGGAVYEGPGTNKWDNLKRILHSCAVEPVWAGGTLSLKISSPKVALFDIGADDLAEGEVSVQAMKGWRDRINTIVPRVRSEAHKWEYEQLQAVSNATYLAEDGETKTREVQYDLVQKANQGAQLAAYDLTNGREYGPVQISVKPAFMPYRPGEAGTVNLAEILGDPALGSQMMTIIGRQIDPSTGVVQLTLESETTAKHAFALGQTGVAPPTPVIVPPQAIDDAVAGDTTVPPAPASITLVEWTDRLVVRTAAIPRALTYRWRFYLADGVTLKREIVTAVPQVEYTKAQAHADGISRSYKVEVAPQNAIGTGTALMSATLNNAAPAAPTGVAFADGTSTSTVTFTPSVSADASAHLVAYSTISGFNPMIEGASFFCSSSPAYTGQLPAATYYGKIAAVNLWTSQPDQVNFSAEDIFVITPGGGGTPPAGGGGGGVGGGGGLIPN